MINYVRNICFFLSLGIFSSYSQHNLVINPSFEELIMCPDNPGEISYLENWDTLKGGGGSSPDLFNECSLSPLCSVPSNFNIGYQLTKSGVGYVGIISLYYNTSNDHREYIQSKLKQTLIQGNKYCVNLYLNLSYRSQYSIKKIGAYFDNGLINSINYQAPYPYIIPQIVNSVEQLDDTLNWIKIEGSFIADGTENYITIGNFYHRDSSGVAHSFPLQSGESMLQRANMAYYYIDDISVIDQSTPAYAGNDTLIYAGDSVFVGRTPEIGLNEACVWYTNGIATDTIAGMWVKPTQTTTYIVEQNLCGQIDHDTVIVSIGIAGLDEVQTQNGIRLYPNPAESQLHIELEKGIKSLIEMNILDISGKLCYNEKLTLGTTQKILDISFLRNGLYVLEFELGNGETERMKFVKK